MKHYLVPTRPIDDGLDRQNLAILKKRFLAINSDRLERMRSALAARHRLFLDALPILFHSNHPMLPGFTNRYTPCKVSGYKPGKPDIEIARNIARSFTLNYEPELAEEILGIYVMGSVGTVAQSDDSDLDIWLCHSPEIDATRLQHLQKKCEGISAWAAQQRLEVHFFLMNYEAFKRGELESLNQESSGSAQRLLLLDEFYRSAIFIAGRIPLWWFVPDTKEIDYREHANTLTQKKYIADKHCIDFGGLAAIPSGEFIGAGIWQLYKAIEAPYKSVLKLLLLEAYVSEYPNITALSLIYKKMIYAGEMNIDHLDSYVMAYSRIEQYLIEKNQPKRLDLARRCFYFKVNRRLSRSTQSSHRPWQRELLKKMVAQWAWPAEKIELLDGRSRWKAEQVSQERTQLVTELNNSYQILLEFAQNDKQDRAISAEELTVLGRKLQAAFERRPGKIEWINPNISDDLSEDGLSVKAEVDEASQKTFWSCFTERNKQQALKSADNLVELMLWCYFNGIITASTPIEVLSTDKILPSEMRRLVSVFEQWFPQGRTQSTHENFLHAAKPTHALILLNVAQAAPSELSSQGMQLLSNNTDALRYGGYEDNLVVCADIVSRNSWQELHSRHFDGDNALLHVLEEYLQLSLPGTHQAPPELRIECVGSQQAPIITHRVREWFAEIMRCFYGSQALHSRFLFQLSGKYYCLQFKGLRPQFTAYTSDDALLESLGAASEKFSPIVVDSRALRDTALPLISSRVKAGTVNIFFRRFDIGMEFYAVDEKGSISYERYRGLSNFNPLIPLHRFLRAAINRQSMMYPEITSDFGILPVYFFELLKRPGENLHAIQKHVAQDLRNTLVFEVKAIAHSSDGKLIRYDFVCAEQEFRHRDFGDQLYLVVAQFVLSRRETNDSYPIYITDMDLAACAKQLGNGKDLQLTHYLRVKGFLEFKLNQAIGILMRA